MNSRRWIAIFACGALAYSLFACSFTKRVDRGRIVAADSSIDASSDVDGEVHEQTCPMQIERACTDGSDDDCDGFVDCADLDCSNNLSCCRSGTGVPLPGIGPWSHALPSGAQPSLTTGGAISARIGSFLSNQSPRALRLDRCVPLELGVTVSAAFQAVGAPTQCPAGQQTCVHYAALVFTPAEGMVDGDGLADDLALRHEMRSVNGVYRSLLRITRGGETLLSSDNIPLVSQDFNLEQVNVTVSFTPGVDNSGNAGIFASVSVTAGATQWSPLTRRFIVQRNQMLACEIGGLSGRGLHIAAEGVGDRVSISGVDVRFNECPNPANLSPSGPILRGPQLLGAQASWASGALTAPSVALYTAASRNAEVTELLVSATNVDPRSAPFTNVNYALAGAKIFSDLGTWAARQSGMPVLGHMPPTCVGGQGPECTSPMDVAEPSLLAPTAGTLSNGSNLFIAYRSQIGNGADTLRTARLGQSPSALVVEDVDALSGINRSDCQEVRQPALFPRSTPDGVGGFYLLYICRAQLASPSVRGVLLDADLSNPRAIAIELPSADWTRAGAVDLAVVTWFGAGAAPEPVSYKLWLLAQGASGRALGYFEAPYSSSSELLVFRPYSANPVLVQGDALLAACGAACALDGLGVARSTVYPREARLYLGVHGEITGQTQYGVLPFLQRFSSAR